MYVPCKYNVSDNINLYIIKDKKYKTVTASVYLHRKLSRSEVTENSLLSKVLKCGTARYVNPNDLNIYAENLFGCAFDVGITKRADIQSIVSTVSAVTDRFAGEPVIMPSVELMLDLMFRPYLPGGTFFDDYIRTQKNNLKDDIESLINDKRAYANVRCIEEMCGGEPNAIVEIGYTEDIAGISAESLTKHYEKIIISSPIDIFVVGDVDGDEILKFLKNYFSDFDFVKSDLKIDYIDKKVISPKFVRDRLDVNQGKLAMGFRTSVNINNPLYYALLVGNSIFGSGAHSKLFNNVREKMSLCYYAYSRLDKYNSLMLVGSGIEFDKFEKTRDAVLHELECVKNGDFTDSELDVAKEYIIGTNKSLEDNPSMLSDYYMGLRFTPDLLSLDEVSEKVKNVTRDDIKEAFSHIALDTVYFLSGKENM